MTKSNTADACLIARRIFSETAYLSLDVIPEYGLMAIFAGKMG